MLQRLFELNGDKLLKIISLLMKLSKVPKRKRKIMKKHRRHMKIMIN